MPTIDRETSPFAGIAMSAHERRNAELYMRNGEWLADLVIAIFRAPRALFRRLHKDACPNR